MYLGIKEKLRASNVTKGGLKVVAILLRILPYLTEFTLHLHCEDRSINPV
jgi:hypothetical protein